MKMCRFIAYDSLFLSLALLFLVYVDCLLPCLCAFWKWPDYEHVICLCRARIIHSFKSSDDPNELELVGVRAQNNKSSKTATNYMVICDHFSRNWARIQTRKYQQPVLNKNRMKKTRMHRTNGQRFASFAYVLFNAENVFVLSFNAT